MVVAKKLFTPGPVPIEEHILAKGAEQLPYNRTQDFSRLTQEILQGLGYVFQTNGSIAILTSSGTAAMEASVLGFLDDTDHVLIVNGGTFGQRWCDLCSLHAISHTQLNLVAGEDIYLDQLSETLSSGNYTAVLINAHETSTGQLYDLQSIGRVTKQLGLLFIVDGVSTICADPFFMDEWHVDVAILSSQKALALPPGLAFVAMNERALTRHKEITPKSLYFNLQKYLKNQERGQLPYTPAVGILMQLHQRLLDIEQCTLEEIIHQHKNRADYFRKSVTSLPFSVLPSRQSNAMTAIFCKDQNAFEIVQQLRDHCDIEVAPSGGGLKNRIFRVSHMGAQNEADADLLIQALCEITGNLTRGNKCKL